jgi:hypothetical protein
MRTQSPNNAASGIPHGGPSRQGGSLAIGCGIGCASILVVALIALLLFVRWLFGPSPIPDPQTAMLPQARSFLVARLDPSGKPMMDLINRISDAAAETVPKEERRPPWPIRWVIGDEPAAIARKVLPVQIVYSDLPRPSPNKPDDVRMSIVFSPGRGRGLVRLLSYMIQAASEKEAARKDFLKHTDKGGQERIILRGNKADEKSPMWFAVTETGVCASNTEEGAKEILDALAKPPAAPSPVAALYPALREGAVMCGASSDLLRMQQVSAWLRQQEGDTSPPLPLRGISLATFKLSLTEQMSLHTAIEFTCAGAEAAQGLQQAAQANLAAKQQAQKLMAVRALSQGNKVYVDFDVPKVDELIIKSIREKHEEKEKK